MAPVEQQGVDSTTSCCPTTPNTPHSGVEEERDLEGVWERQWETVYPSGTCDRETLVWWIQSSGSIYVDLRIPPSLLRFYKEQILSKRGVRTTMAEPPGNLLLLQGVSESFYQTCIQTDSSLETALVHELQSFAGRLEQTASSSSSSPDPPPPTHSFTCHWHRAIDIRPPAVSPDIGVCTYVALPEEEEDRGWDGTCLHETGVDGSYAELWWRRPQDTTSSSPRSASCSSYALELLVAEATPSSNDKGYWVVVNNRFGYAVGRPWPATTTQGGTTTWQQIFEERGSISPQAQLDTILSSYLAVMGEILDDGTFRILYSTHPEWIGSAFPTGTVQADGGGVEQCLGGTKRIWKVVSTSGDYTQVPPFGS